MCREEYIKAFVEKDSTIHAVDATAWDIYTSAANSVEWKRSMVLLLKLVVEKQIWYDPL